ncbi:MAG TPA: DUF1549 domain-containing protein [Gemmataceae bacterium]|nr:DUF1549 domain-containing protein [Gemmataceae bacterium]
MSSLGRRQAATIAASLLLLSLPHLQAADHGANPAAKFFEERVRPVLANRCFQCHGPEKQKNGLRLDSLKSMLKGGESGPAIKPGKPEESLLIRAIRHSEQLQMPPKTKLPAREIADLTAWIKMGAPWPDAKLGVRADSDPQQPLFTPEEKSFWAFQPPAKPPLPTVKHVAWIKSPIDEFILAALEQKGLQPAPPAEKRVLIRRATFDLTGLPPTPEEIDAFLRDESPEAFASMIESIARFAPLWRALGPALARCSPLCGLQRHGRKPGLRQRLALSRLRRRRLQQG